MRFESALGPAASDAAGWWFFFHGTDLLVSDGDDGTPAVPRADGPAALGLRPDTASHVGDLDGVPCFAAGFYEAPAALPAGHRFVGLRELFGVLPEPLYAAGGRAAHIAQWELAHRFCGRCAHPTELHAHERARHCAHCGQLYYPQISPAVIVAVRRGDEILLARSARFRTQMFSVLAGFVEPGETLEECVRREIREESGIEVQNIRYFASQPWPYPNSLMLGFTADYAAGDIQVDGVEVLEAHWYRADALPQIPGKLSIARALIDAFVASAGRP